MAELITRNKINNHVPTAFIMEKVTNYLNPEAIEQTFLFFKQFPKKSYLITI